MLCWNCRPFAIGAVQRRPLLCRRLRGPCFRRIDAFDLPDAEIKRVMCRRSAARVVVATAESIAKTAPFQVSGPDAIDHMLAGRQLDAETLEPFRRQGTLIDHIG